MTGVRTAGVIAPPPLLFLGVLAVGLAADFLVFRMPTGLAADWRWPAAATLAAAGIALILGAAGLFRSAGTPPAPWKPSTALVLRGPYRFTRNPMYLGMSSIYLAIAAAADSLLTILALAPLMALVHVAVVKREEDYLDQTFGEPYRSYRAKVRRWL